MWSSLKIRSWWRHTCVRRSRAPWMTSSCAWAQAASRGAPAPKVTVPLTGAMSLVGGLTIVLGWHRFIGAGLLFIFMLWTSYFIHHFWTETDPVARMNERVHFLKDLAMGGAALFMAYYAGGPWPMSLGG